MKAITTSNTVSKAVDSIAVDATISDSITPDDATTDDAKEQKVYQRNIIKSVMREKDSFIYTRKQKEFIAS